MVGGVAGGMARGGIVRVPFFLLQARGLSPKAVVGASIRKLVHLIYGVIKSGMPFNAEIAMNRLDLQEGI